MVVDRDRPVPIERVRLWCELAQWAPNHKRTWPWRFAMVEGDSRARLGDTIADAMAAQGDPQEKVDKTRTKYMRTPATLVVGAAPGDTELRTAENRDAVAAGVQNVLLAAAAEDVATYWGSCPKGCHQAVAAMCGFEPGTYIVAIVYLGYLAGPSAVPDRPGVDVHHLV